MIRCSVFALVVSAAALCGGPARGVGIVPTSDLQVIETLPSMSAGRAEDRRLRAAMLSNPGDSQSAVQLASRLLSQARDDGDPRLAGQAMAALQAWTDPATTPADVLLMQATVQQFLHDFNGSAKRLEGLLARDPGQQQAWLTLATVRRVQGRYADSDRACAQLLAQGAALYGTACEAENQALRGNVELARQRFQRVLADRRLDNGARNWLLTSVAELEERVGRNAAADAAFRSALAAKPDPYTLIAYADFLIFQGRSGEALALLRGHPRTDGVLLRLAIAGTRSKAPGAADDAREMRERIAQAGLRPQALNVHAREQAMFALWVDSQPQRALALARINVGDQREPIDLLLLAQAAAAARQPAAQEEAERLRKEVGLHDRRLDPLP